jgi:hypothetical protein
VDRLNRDALVAAINRYLDGETTAFKFDDEIFGIDSDDPTISYLVRQLWLFYDDLKDHKAQLSKEAWDYFQRLVLVLQSDAHIEVSTRRRWDYSHVIAFDALLLFVYAAWWLGWGPQLIVLAIPFGAVSIAISWWRGRAAAQEVDKNQIALMPFSSVSELLPLRRRVQNFRKRKYPVGMTPFKVRSPLEETAMKLQSYASWLRFSPLVLMFQVLPTTETNTRIVIDDRRLVGPTRSY